MTDLRGHPAGPLAHPVSVLHLDALSSLDPAPILVNPFAVHVQHSA